MYLYAYYSGTGIIYPRIRCKQGQSISLLSLLRYYYARILSDYHYIVAIPPPHNPIGRYYQQTIGIITIWWSRVVSNNGRKSINRLHFVVHGHINIIFWIWIQLAIIRSSLIPTELCQQFAHFYHERSLVWMEQDRVFFY